MRGLGDFQRRQMASGDPRVREIYSRLRQLLVLLEDIANHPHQAPDSQQQTVAPPQPPKPEPKIVIPQPRPPLLVSIREARRQIGVGHTQIYKMINDGRLETVRIGNRRLIRYDSLRRLAGVEHE